MTNEKTPKEKLLAEWEKRKGLLKKTEIFFEFIDISDLEILINQVAENWQRADLLKTLHYSTDDIEIPFDWSGWAIMTNNAEEKELIMADQVGNRILARSLILQHRLDDGEIDKDYEKRTEYLSFAYMNCYRMKHKKKLKNNPTLTIQRLRKGDQELIDRIKDLSWANWKKISEIQEKKISEIREENKKEVNKLIDEKSELITEISNYQQKEKNLNELIDKTNQEKEVISKEIIRKNQEISNLNSEISNFKKEQEQIKKDINKLFWFNSSTAREAVNKLIDRNKDLKRYEPGFIHHIGDYTGINWLTGKIGATFTVIGFGAVCSVVAPLIFKAWLAYQTAGISLAVEKANAKKKEPEPENNNQPPLIQVINEKIEPAKPKNIEQEITKEKDGEISPTKNQLQPETEADKEKEPETETEPKK